MDMVERGIVHAACREVLIGDRIIGGGGIAVFAVQAENVVNAGLPFRVKAAEQRQRIPVQERCPVNTGIGRGNGEPGDGVFRENMHVFRQLQPGIGRAGRIEIVITGGDEHRSRDTAQTADQFFAGFLKGGAAVQQVTAEQDQVGIFLSCKVRQRLQQLPLLRAAHRGFGRGKTFKGTVEMQVGRMDDLDRSHVSRIASACMHFPVSGLMVNRHPSILAGPLPAS